MVADYYGIFPYIIGIPSSDKNDKSLFSKLRPLLKHIRDTSIYKYNNNFIKKSTIRWKNSNATNIQIISKYKFLYMVAHYYGIFPYIIGIPSSDKNDKSLFSKLRPLLKHIRDTSIYKYNNNFIKKINNKMEEQQCHKYTNNK